MFGDWQLLEPIEGKKTRDLVLCRCSCGIEKRVKLANLKYGLTKKCWDCTRVPPDPTKHGQSISGRKRHGAYGSWLSMRSRCRNPKVKAYPHYGARGITICDRWDDFANFYADMGERPEGKTLDRIDVNGNYEPGNCRWATAFEQIHNRRPRKDYRVVTFAGKPYSYNDLAKLFAVDPATMADRIGRGWDIIAAIGGEQFLRNSGIDAFPYSCSTEEKICA